MKHNAQVVIVGSGLVGCSAAYYLCKQGIKPIVLEKKEIGHGGSSRNAGGVRQSARDPRELPMAMYAVQHIWPGLSEELGIDIEYKQKGNLRLAKTKEHMATLEKTAVKCRALGLEMTMLSGEETRKINPFMSDEVIGSSWCPSDGHANPLLTTLGYYKKAREMGARFITGEEVVSLKKERGKISGVVTKSNEYGAEQVIVASGFESREILNSVGIDIPMRKKLLESLVTEEMPYMFDEMLGVATSDFYGHQTKHGSFVFGGGAGFGNYFDFQKETMATSMTPPVICRGVLRYFPMLKELKVVRVWAGWKDESSDGIPVIGPIEEVPGLYTACGFSGHGFGIAPAAGMELANLIAGGKSALDLSELRYNRFLPAK
ncbi:NAD(P)/FAD-dependent oxidoreductase [Clostridium transplantifaecale]|uniref:NAD(P)/FAD-dependent oxidoreductase n=1 Tax=Clostridium transplantifaecale TaxID=2479838 RepID=UPI000F63261C|nr:FAD-binding oxidoreductase [Clostridium transplantifaecale]